MTCIHTKDRENFSVAEEVYFVVINWDYDSFSLEKIPLYVVHIMPLVITQACEGIFQIRT